VIVDVDATPGGGSDLIAVVGNVTYAGTVEVRSPSASLATGCGERRAFVVNTSLGTHAGAFTGFVGLDDHPRQNWRLRETSLAMLLMGYARRSSVDYARVPPATVVEGGAGGSVELCLGAAPPTANVAVTPTSVRGQVGFAPSTLTFTPADYALPQRVTIAAIDDSSGEGPHVDTVRFTVASADPAHATDPADAGHLVLVRDNDPGADLAVALVTWDSTVAVGENFDARFRITNLGPAPSGGATFTLQPMGGFDYAHGGSGVSCAQSGSVLTCTVGPLAAGAQVEFSPVFTARTAGAHTVTIRVAGADHDHVSANDALAWTVTIN
jgi:hypothetical protein